MSDQEYQQIAREELAQSEWSNVDSDYIYNEATDKEIDRQILKLYGSKQDFISLVMSHN